MLLPKEELFTNAWLLEPEISHDWKKCFWEGSRQREVVKRKAHRILNRA